MLVHNEKTENKGAHAPYSIELASTRSKGDIKNCGTFALRVENNIESLKCNLLKKFQVIK